MIPAPNIFPFTAADLANLLWASVHYPPAAAAIVQAENAATDNPQLRTAKNHYIGECLAAIRRRREHVETALALFDAGIGGEDLERLCEASGPVTTTNSAPNVSEPVARPKRSPAGRQTQAGSLYAEVG